MNVLIAGGAGEIGRYLIKDLSNQGYEVAVIDRAPEAQEMETRTFYEGDLSLYTSFDHPKGWSRQLIRQYLDKELRRHPAIAPILRRDPPVFTSNHAPLFVMNGMTG